MVYLIKDITHPDRLYNMLNKSQYREVDTNGAVVSQFSCCTLSNASVLRLCHLYKSSVPLKVFSLFQ